MDWKIFFKPTQRKITIFLISFIIAFIAYVNYLPISFPIMILLGISCYIISCLINWFFKRNKNVKEVFYYRRTT